MARKIGLPKKRQIITLIVILFVVGFVSISIVSYYTTANLYKKDLSDSILPLTGDNIYSEIRRDLITLVLISSLMGNDTFLVDWTLHGEQDTVLVSKYLATIQERYNTVTCFFASDISGAYYHSTGLFTTISENNPRDAWFYRIRDAEEKYQINLGIDDANDGALTIFINHKVFDYDGNFIGVTGCGLTVENVQELLDDYAERYNRIIYLVDQQHEVLLTNNIAPPWFKNIEEVQDLRELSLDSALHNPLSVSYSRNNEEYLLNIRYVSELDLFLFVEQSLNANHHRHTQIWLLLKIFFITLPIGAVIILSILLTANAYQAELETLATTDRLTEMSNRHAFEIVFHQALKEAERRQQPLVLILFDIDYFKRVNDQYGHPAGDAVLKRVASIARESLRDADSLCRWGGEEFLVLLSDCSLENGLIIAEQLRKAIQETMVCYGDESISVRISLGVAQWQEDESPREFLQRVDQALYRAKNNGRNRVETS